LRRRYNRPAQLIHLEFDGHLTFIRSIAMLTFASLALIALLAFANGSNDVSKSVATLVGGGVANYRKALRWGTIWTTVGALLGGIFAAGIAERFAASLGPAAHRQAAIPVAIIISAVLFVAFCSRTGLPVSTTHAIAGAILGVGWLAEGLSPLSRTDLLVGFFLPLLASPVMALALAYVAVPATARFGQWLDARCACAMPAPAVIHLNDGSAAATQTLNLVIAKRTVCEGRSMWSWTLSLDQLHWASSGLVAMSRGMNDAPKIWALAFPLFILAGAGDGNRIATAIVIVALAMGLGSWAGGRRVTEVLAERVTRMNHEDGLGANLVTALLVVGASRLGLPVSTTHVSSGAILGVGMRRGRQGIHWRVVNEMLLAWFVTLPAAGILAALAYLLLRR
jgi:inorganic phosphate transporter, PiT family